MTGPNQTLAVVLVALGLVLLVGDLLLPTGGVLTVLALVALLIGVGIPFAYGDTATGLTLVATIVVALPALGAFIYYWPRTVMGRRLFQTGPEEDETVASMPVNLELEQLRGRCGRAISDLRPSGVVDFDGRRIDCLTPGIMVEAGTPVCCIDVKAGKVVVMPVDEPKLSDLENADFSP